MYIGNTPEQQAFTPAVDYFSGNGSTTAFTLSRPVASTAQIQVTVENVPQAPGTAYTVSGNTITFDGAPPSGTNNIYVYYTSPITQVIQPGQGTVGTAQIQSGVLTPTAVSDQLNASTGYFDLPAGTTAQRPSSPVNGMTRYNTTINQFEFYQNGSWIQYNTSYSVEYLVIAGGGGGGGAAGGTSGGGGGGAGGVSASTAVLISTTSYPITVGAGGAGGASSTGLASQGVAGSNSVFSGVTTAIGGGRGPAAGSYASTDPSACNGGPGGSGGGATGGGSGSHTGGAGTPGQGNAGGNAITTAPNYGSGGGGGATSAGGIGSNTVGGNGGTATSAYSTWATATSTGVSGAYAGGGGGGTYNGGTPGSSGGGGSTAGQTNGNAVTNATANTGSGGGGQGASGGSGGVGANGGSGIVIIRYAGSQRGTGGTVVTTGGFTYHTFTTSGTFTA